MAESPNPVTGVLRIEIPDPALSLTLTFEAGEEGDQWDADRLAHAVAERGVKEPLHDQLAAFLQHAASTKGPVTKTLLEGSPPELPTPERVTWSDELDIPEAWQPVRDTVLAEAPSPQIYREVKEKVERQKQVAKKGLLGLGAGKTETVTVTETETRRERVYIDPAVEQSWAVEQGQTVGTMTAGSAGAPGKDIFGRPVPAKQLADPRFYLGDNISRKGDSLEAAAEGFLRVGRNWADIVPFSPHRWNVELSRDRATCYLALTPGHHAAPLPDGTSILKAAIDLPYPESSLMSADELDDLVRQQIESGSAETVPISSSRDASFDIVVSEDKLQALLYIHKGKGRGKTLNLKEIGKAIKESRLKGLDFKKISDDIKTFYNSTEFDLTGYLLTEGRAPTPGPARQVEFSLRFEPDERRTRLLTALKEADAENRPESIEAFPADAVQKVARVEHEQLVATIDPVTPGEAGTDVYGATIEAPSGAEPTFHLHENLERKGPIIATTAPGVLDYAEIEGAYHLRVRAHVDAHVAVELDRDHMQAMVSLREGSGTGVRLSIAAVKEELARKQVTVGVDEEVIAKAVAAAGAGTDVDRVVVARGEEPVDQSENRLEMLVDMEHDTGVRIRKDGSADFRTRNEIVTVKAGEHLCRILPSQQQPVDGSTVTGEKIPAKTVSGLELDLGENIRREEQDDGSTLLVAETEGEFTRIKNRMEVRTTHTIKGDVDMSVGNIKFPGTVVIGGTVRSGFYVVSEGDIKIAGGVEGALLSSEGDILVKLGVKGAGKAVLRSKGAVKSPFFELTTVLSVGDVVAKTAMVRSRIKCNGRIVFQGDKSRVVGRNDSCPPRHRGSAPWGPPAA